MIKRTLYPLIKKHLSNPEISLIIGPRQAGKTTLMLLLQQELSSQGEKTIFLNLDNDLDRQHFTSQSFLLQKIKLELGKNSGYVFIDEIQRKENAGLFLKGLYDRKLPYKFIVSGSGSVELKEKVHESLVGRKRLFELSTISFLEFVNYKTEYRYESKISEFFAIEKQYTRQLLNEYLNFGGYPQVVVAETASQKQVVMNEIYQSYLEKDIALLLKLKKPESLTHLVRIMADQSGKMVNYSELSSTLNLAVATVKNYLWYLEKTFILEKTPPFFQNVRKEITKSPVYYFHDLGLKNYAQRRFGRDDFMMTNGHLFENFVWLQLHERLSQQFGLYFWRTKDKAEVDFIVDQGSNLIPIEVKFKELSKTTVMPSLRSFIKKYHPPTAYVIHLGQSMSRRVGTTQVRFISYLELVGHMAAMFS